MNSPSKKLKAETQTLPAELSPSPMSPATTAPVSCSSSSLSSSPSLACTRPSPISVNSDSRTSDRSVIEILSEAEAEDESDSNDDKKPIAKSPNYYKFNARIREEDHTEEQEEEEDGEPKTKLPSNEFSGDMNVDAEQLLVHQRDVSGDFLGENISGTNFTYLQGAKVASTLSVDDEFCGFFLGKKVFVRNFPQAETRIQARLLNCLFPFDKSKFLVDWMERSTKNVRTNAKNIAHYAYPKRMGTVFKGTKGSFRDSQGKVTSDGITLTVTISSFAKVMFMLLKELDIKKGRNLITLDLGSGQGIPSMLMSQFYGDGPSGLHIGIEQDQGLVATSRYNAKIVASTAQESFHRGCYEKEYIEMHGETEKTCFPNTLFVHGDICQISSLKPFDVLYGFDAANSTESKRHIAKLWNQANPGTRNLHGMSQCPNPKHLLSNSNMQEILDLGFADIIPLSKVKIRISGSGETLTTYLYGRESLLEQGKNNQTYSYENPLPLGEVCPIFQSAWKDYLAGRRQMEDTNSHVCNRAILDRLLSEEYYQETLPKRSERKRISRSQELEAC